MALQAIAANVAALGWGNGLLYSLGQILRRVSGGRVRLVRYLLVAQPVPAEVRPQCRPSAKNPVRPVAPSDPLVQQFPRPRHVIAQRFRDGSTCLVAQSDERFIGYLWLARGAYDEDEVRCRYEFARPGESSWDYDVYVAPDFRIGRTLARLWDASNAHLSRDGVRWTFSRISAFNPGSLAAHGRFGTKVLHTASFLCLGGVQIAFIGAAPYLHLSLSDRSRPTLRLRPPAG